MSTPVQGRGATLRLALAVLRALVVQVLIDPVREGRLDHRQWPAGLMPLAVLAGVGYAAAAALAVFAEPIRRADVLVNSYETSSVLPATASSVLLLLVFLSLALLVTASLHGPWYLGLASLAVMAMIAAPFAVGRFGFLGLVSLVLLVALWLLRRGRRFSWWEFPAVASIVWLGTHLPWLTMENSKAFGVNSAPTLLSSVLSSLTLAAIPALLAAGGALGQVAVLAADTTVSALARSASRSAWWMILAGLLLWRVIDLAGAILDNARWLQPAALLSGMAHLALAWATVWLVLRLARRSLTVAPAQIASGLAGAFVLIGAGLSWPLLALVPGATLNAIATTIGWTELAAATGWITATVQSNLALNLLRALFGVIVIVASIPLIRKGRQGLGVGLAAFGAGTLLDLSVVLAGLDGRTTADPLCLVGPVLAILLAGWRFASRTFDGSCAWGLGTVLMVSAGYAHRDWIADPVTALLGFSGVAVLLFGLTWRVLTDGAFTNTDSRAFPRAVRVLLFLGYLLFAMCVVAYVSLARATGGSADVTPFGERGDEFLGTSLLVSALICGLSALLRRRTQVVETA